MIFAGIDIGSNAVRLLLSDVFAGEGKQGENEVVSSKVALVRVPLRLGEDVFSVGYIRPESEQALIDTLQAFKQLMAVYKTADFAVCATAAMREASNGNEVVSRVKAATGINIRVIDGLEEAQIIRTAGESLPEERYDTTVYVDVGGGSTEISVTENGRFLQSYSFKLGTLRLLHKAEDPHEFDRLQAWLQQFSSRFGHINMVGSGGNINKLTKLFGDKAGLNITLPQLQKGCKKLEGMSVEERMAVFKLRTDRADVILPAARIFLFIAQQTGAEQIWVPRFGLADGLVCELYRHRKEA